MQSAQNSISLTGGRGGRRGRGGRGRRGGGRGSSKPKTKDELDAELDQYNMQDQKHAQTQLNNDLDDYFKNKGTKKSEADVPAEGQEAEEAAE